MNIYKNSQDGFGDIFLYEERITEEGVDALRSRGGMMKFALSGRRVLNFFVHAMWLCGVPQGKISLIVFR